MNPLCGTCCCFPWSQPQLVLAKVSQEQLVVKYSFSYLLFMTAEPQSSWGQCQALCEAAHDTGNCEEWEGRFPRGCLSFFPAELQQVSQPHHLFFIPQCSVSSHNEAIRNPAPLSSTLAQLCRAAWHSVQRCRKKDLIPRMLPIFICYTPRTAVRVKQGGEKLCSSPCSLSHPPGYSESCQARPQMSKVLNVSSQLHEGKQAEAEGSVSVWCSQRTDSQR